MHPGSPQPSRPTPQVTLTPLLPDGTAQPNNPERGLPRRRSDWPAPVLDATVAAAVIDRIQAAGHTSSDLIVNSDTNNLPDQVSSTPSWPSSPRNNHGRQSAAVAESSSSSSSSSSLSSSPSSLSSFPWSTAANTNRKFHRIFYRDYWFGCLTFFIRGGRRA